MHREPGPRGGFQDQNCGEVTLVESALAFFDADKFSSVWKNTLNTYDTLPSSVLFSLRED